MTTSSLYGSKLQTSAFIICLVLSLYCRSVLSEKNTVEAWKTNRLLVNRRALIHLKRIAASHFPHILLWKMILLTRRIAGTASSCSYARHASLPDPHITSLPSPPLVFLSVSTFSHSLIFSVRICPQTHRLSSMEKTQGDGAHSAASSPCSRPSNRRRFPTLSCRPPPS